MPDPITALKRFDDPTPVPALPPEEVRRRGDRLRLRNRAALAGAAVLVVVAGSVGISTAIGNDGPSHIQPAPAPTSSPTQAPPSATKLTPEGYGAVHLGMSAAEVRATGLASKVVAPRNGMCGSFQLKGFPSREHTVDGYISAKNGVESVAAAPGVTTREGIGPGSTVADAKAAYPGGHRGQGHWVQSNGYLIVPLGHGLEYEFGIEQVLDPQAPGQEHTIGETMVTVSRSSCFG